MDLELWKQIKKEKQLTISDIAKLSGIPKGSVQNIFCGYVPNPRIDTIEAIEKALGIGAQASELSDKETRLLTAFNGLIPPMQDYIIEMVEKLVAQPQNVKKTI